MRVVLSVFCLTFVAAPALGQKRRVVRRPTAHTALVLRVAAARTLPARVSPAHRASLRNVVVLLRGKKQAAARVAFGRFAKGYFNASTKIPSSCGPPV